MPTIFPAVTLAQEPVADTPVAKIPIDTTPITEAPITSTDRSHWSFAPIKMPTIPAVKAADWARTSIDTFIRAKLEEKNLAPQPEAPRSTLLRRLSFDLTGLPPTPAELAAFESDKSPDAYERLVDRLFASPAFGQRYGQYWLDLARFAETDGYEHDKVRPQAWKYRDWVVSSLNADMPYNEFIRRQLAGDEQEVRGQKSEVSAVATMFCLSGGDMPDINDQAERRHNLLNEMTATVGSVFLGLQLGCAQCHNHKYDPLSQADFYRLRAVFEPAVPILKRDAPYNVLATQKEPPAARFWVRGDHKRPGLELQPDFPRIATLARSASEGNVVSTSIRSALAEWLVRPTNPLTSRVAANRLWQFHFGRGISTTPSDFGIMGAAPTHPELLDYLATDLRDHDWEMKRLNRLIVISATYRQASNAESGTGSSASIPHSALRASHSASDPDNALYSSFPRQRLSGEAIRDSMLSVSGLLTTEWQGPSVMPPLPEELLSSLLKGQWTASKREADHFKRSIYVFARRNLRYPIFEAFDRPDGNASCPLRNKSTTAPQSLLLFNSELSLLAARHLAGRVLNDETAVPNAAEQINRLYAIALGRHPSATEIKTLQSFVTSQQKNLATDNRSLKELALPIPSCDATDPYTAAALVDACLAVMNTSEFLYID